MTGSMTTTPQISTLEREITVLTERLREPGDAVALRCLEMLLTAGFVFPSSIDPEQAAKVYGFALSRVPAVGIDSATKKLIRGEYERDGHRYLPLPPEWAALARKEAEKIREDRMRAIERRDAYHLANERAKPVDPAAKARVRALVARATAALTVSDAEIKS